MPASGFREHMGVIAERMFFTPPKPEDRLKPWTSADIAKFAAANPKAAADMQTLRSAGLVSGLGGLAGAGAGAAFFFSRPGTFNGKLFSAVLGHAPALPPACPIATALALGAASCAHAPVCCEPPPWLCVHTRNLPGTRFHAC